ncbi:MAG: hypothetical protein PVF27_07020, partial [Gemmatimonadales bacterium]
MTERHRRELIAIVSLLVGVFLALTLLPWDITGAFGRFVGRQLWTALGLGAAILPILGLAVGLVGFGRFRRLDVMRVAVLFGGLVVLVPYAIAV